MLPTFASNAGMDILLVSATPFEIAPLSNWLQQTFQSNNEGVFSRKELNLKILVTGVGPVFTAFSLGRFLAGFRPHWTLNAGVAGAFDPQLQLGQVVQVVRERFGDLGVEENDGRFTDLFELGLCDADEPPFQQGELHHPALSLTDFLPKVNGLTVSKVHGSAASIAAIRSKYPDAQIETMEGAAFFYACLANEVPFTQIRAVSNYVEPRNRAGWRLQDAIGNLNEVLIDLLQTLVDQEP